MNQYDDGRNNVSIQSENRNDLDYETTIFQALVNEGKYIRVPISRRAQFSFNEKELRDAAHAEVARVTAHQEEKEMNSKKRKGINTEDNLNNRDRNREHAKNTRLRKKCYVKKLQELVDRMNAQKELEERERKSLGQRIFDTQTTRKNVIRMLLSNRAENVADRERWSCILDEQHTLTLPITPYRSFNQSEIHGGHRVVKGIDALLADTASLSLLVEGVGQGSDRWRDAIKSGQGCRLCYLTAKEDMLAAGDFVMCRYLMRVEGWEQAGAKSGVVQQGMMHCRFDRDSNKLVAVEMVFDVMGFLQQLQRASGLSSQAIVTTNTVEKALQLVKAASVTVDGQSSSVLAVVSSSTPFTVLSASPAWSALCGADSSTSSSETHLLTQLRAHDFQNEMLVKLLSDAAEGRPGSAIYMARDKESSSEKSSSPLVHYLKVTPLTGDAEPSPVATSSSSSLSSQQHSVVPVSHLLVELVDLPLTDAEAATLLSNRVDESLSAHVSKRQASEDRSSSGGREDAFTFSQQSALQENLRGGGQFSSSDAMPSFASNSDSSQQQQRLYQKGGTITAPMSSSTRSS